MGVMKWQHMLMLQINCNPNVTFARLSSGKQREEAQLDELVGSSCLILCYEKYCVVVKCELLIP